MSAGGASFCYDANGNLTADGSSVYLYDVENRLVEKRSQTNTNCNALSYSGALQAELRYDPLARLFRVSGGSSGTMFFLHDGNALIMEIASSGAVRRRYVHGSNVEADDPLVWYEGGAGSGAGRRFVHADPRGSIVAVTDYRGISTATNTYDEYGIPDTASGDDIATKGRFRYTGQAWIPELGMYYYKARIYSPTLGRFLQTDPIGYEDQFNLYAYVANDPINGVDFTGLEAYYISRPVFFESSPFDHAFVGVREADGTITIFSYTDVDGVLRPSDPNEIGGTYDTDRAYFESFLDDPNSVPGNQINASDSTVLAVGRAYNEALTVNNIDYDIRPRGGDGCNSNCAAGIVADESVQAEGGRGHPAPRNAQVAPGRESRSRLDPLVRTPRERELPERFFRTYDK